MIKCCLWTTNFSLPPSGRRYRCFKNETKQRGWRILSFSLFGKTTLINYFHCLILTHFIYSYCILSVCAYIFYPIVLSIVPYLSICEIWSGARCYMLYGVHVTIKLWFNLTVPVKFWCYGVTLCCFVPQSPVSCWRFLNLILLLWIFGLTFFTLLFFGVRICEGPEYNPIVPPVFMCRVQ